MAKAWIALIGLMAAFQAQSRELVRQPPDMQDAVGQVQAALAGATKSLSRGAQIAVFPYRQNKIYEIGIKPGKFTTFTLPKDEPIKDFGLDIPDAVELRVNPEANSVMLRLLSNVTMSATIVTEKRPYYLTLSPASEAWHQGVSWIHDGGQDSGFGYSAPASKTAGAALASDTTSGIPAPEDSLAGHPNFNYVIEGDQAILPISVWDNGRFTWLQFPNSVQSLPAVFYLGPDGAEVVNYVVQPGGKQVKVNRLMDRILLRLGSLKGMVTTK